ncbi:ferredoxin [Sulfuracidifex tepidarius]|uniref:ferredoxin n=1 Tax=Sulfuracidifex tepidarius TaxID=1294262 RepID=UPI001E57BED1|nr:ferredoxin [Sulfuracidifex tepidarius]
METGVISMYVKSRVHSRRRAPFDCEKGLPYVEVVDGGEVVENCFPPQPTSPGGVRISSTLIHSKLVRNQFLLERVSRISNLPEDVERGGEVYQVEKMKAEHVIIGAGISGLTALKKEGGVLIASDTYTDTFLDPLNPMKEKAKSILKEMGDKVIQGDFLGKFSEGYAFRIGKKIVVFEDSRITFAMGGRYLPPRFEGNDLPGVISRDMYLRFRENYRDVLVLGSCDDAVRTAVVSGSRILIAPRGTDLMSPVGKEMAEDHGIHLQGVTYLNVTVKGRKLYASWDDGETLVDAVVFAPVKQPRLEGIANVGCDYKFVPGMGAYIPEHDDEGYMECGHRVVGGARGIDDPSLSEASVEDSLRGKIQGPLRFYYEGGGKADPYNYGGGGYACMCEDVMWEDVLKFREFGNVEMLKRVSGICLGECQGKTCSFVVGSLMKSDKLITFRSPLYPV